MIHQGYMQNFIRRDPVLFNKHEINHWRSCNLLDYSVCMHGLLKVNCCTLSPLHSMYVWLAKEEKSRMILLIFLSNHELNVIYRKGIVIISTDKSIKKKKISFLWSPCCYDTNLCNKAFSFFLSSIVLYILDTSTAP